MRKQPTPDTGLKGRAAVVTGAGSGMGRAIALELARRGARLAAVDVDAARLERLKNEVGADDLEQTGVRGGQGYRPCRLL